MFVGCVVPGMWEVGSGRGYAVGVNVCMGSEVGTCGVVGCNVCGCCWSWQLSVMCFVCRCGVGGQCQVLVC